MKTYVFGGLDADAVDADAQLVGLVELGKDRVDVRVLAQLVQARHMPQVDAAVHGQLGPGLLCVCSPTTGRQSDCVEQDEVAGDEEDDENEPGLRPKKLSSRSQVSAAMLSHSWGSTTPDTTR